MNLFFKSTSVSHLVQGLIFGRDDILNMDDSHRLMWMYGIVLCFQSVNEPCYFIPVGSAAEFGM